MGRSALRSACRGGISGKATASSSMRSFSSKAHQDEAAEAAKWEKITCLGIATCAILTVVNLSKGHPHSEPPPVPMVCLRRGTTDFVDYKVKNSKITVHHPSSGIIVLHC